MQIGPRKKNSNSKDEKSVNKKRLDVEAIKKYHINFSEYIKEFAQKCVDSHVSQTLESSQEKMSESDCLYNLSLIRFTRDPSEFIILLMKYIKAISPQETLEKVKEHHFNFEYAQAIEILLNLLDIDSLKFLINNTPVYSNMPDDNHNRRFIETMFSLFLMEHVTQHKIYNSIEKLLPTIINFRDLSKKKFDLPETIDNIGMATYVIEKITMLSDKIELDLKKKSLIYSEKDRAGRGLKKEKSYSRNIGILKSNTPSWYNLISNSDFLEKVVDKFKVDTDKFGYSRKNNEIPFVNSVSGSAFTVSVLLIDYMEKNKNDLDLKVDIKNIITCIVALYILRGYHSLNEIKAVFEDPTIKSQFEQYGVVLDFVFPIEIINETYQASEAYTSTICLKRTIPFELGNIVLTPAFTNCVNNKYPDNPQNDKEIESKNNPASKKRGF